MDNPLLTRFKPGDRVVRVEMDTTMGPNIGATGTVLRIFENPSKKERILAAVNWDEALYLAHNCDGLCDFNHGWNVVVTDIELAELELDFDFSESEFCEVVSCLK